MKFISTGSTLLLLSLHTIVSASIADAHHHHARALDHDKRQFGRFGGGRGGQAGGRGGNAAVAGSGAAAQAAGVGTAAAAQVGKSTATENNTDPQNSLTLDASQAQPGLTLDGQQVPAANQVASATSGNNFINFCLTRTDLPLTNGAQVKTGSCNPTVMGVIAPQARMPSSKFSFPPNGATIAANQDFTITMNIRNLVTGNFVSAQSNYFAAPQNTDGSGTIIGHSHVVIEAISSLGSTTASDPTSFAFFKGLNTAAVNGVLSANVPGGLPPGTYKMSSINTAANHQPALVAVAQHGSLDDAVYFTATVGGGAAAGGVAAGGAAAGGAAGGANNGGANNGGANNGGANNGGANNGGANNGGAANGGQGAGGQVGGARGGNGGAAAPVVGATPPVASSSVAAPVASTPAAGNQGGGGRGGFGGGRGGAGAGRGGATPPAISSSVAAPVPSAPAASAPAAGNQGGGGRGGFGGGRGGAAGGATPPAASSSTAAPVASSSVAAPVASTPVRQAGGGRGGRGGFGNIVVPPQAPAVTVTVLPRACTAKRVLAKRLAEMENASEA